MNIESDRTDKDIFGKDRDVSDFRDPLDSVRFGDDLEENSSKMSDCQYMTF